MPLTAKGKKIKAAMKKEYGDKKGEQVFYASENAGKFHGAVKKNSSKGYKAKLKKKAGKAKPKGFHSQMVKVNKIMSKKK